MSETIGQKVTPNMARALLAEVDTALGFSGPLSARRPRTTVQPISGPRRHARDKDRKALVEGFGHGAPIPMRCGYPDLYRWFDTLDYDPRSATERREQRQREQQEEEKRRQMANSNALHRKLMTLSGAMRSEMQIFVDHLLDYGVRHHQIGNAASKHLFNLRPNGKDSPRGSHAPHARGAGHGLPTAPSPTEGTRTSHRKRDDPEEGDADDANEVDPRGKRTDSTRDFDSLPGRPGHQHRGGTGVAQSLQQAMEDGVLPSQMMYMQLRDCFEILDFDESGTITVDELRRASRILERREGAEEKAFRTLDSNRSGAIDFPEMLRVFFPKAHPRQLAKLHAVFGRPYEVNGGRLPTRDRLAQEDFRELQGRYLRYCGPPPAGDAAGQPDARCCTLSRLERVLYSEEEGGHNAKNAVVLQWGRSLLREIFQQYDVGGKGYLTFDEFLEMFKFSYPPFSGPRLGQEDNSSLAWLAHRRDRDPGMLSLPAIPAYLPPRGSSTARAGQALQADAPPSASRALEIIIANRDEKERDAHELSVLSRTARVSKP